jgi:hypothetical protein
MTSQARESRHHSRFGSLPRLVPLFPVGALTPDSVCGHRGPIERGSIFCCVICHTSGYDHHPDLQIDAPTALLQNLDSRDLLPQKPKRPKSLQETRKERRRKLFATLAAVNQIRQVVSP